MHFCCGKKRKSVRKVLHSVDISKIYSHDFFLKKKREINVLSELTGELHRWLFSRNFFQSVSKIFVFPHCILTTSTSGSFTLILFSIRCLQTYCWVKWIHSKKNILKEGFFFFSEKLHRVFWKLKIKSMKSWCTLEHFTFYFYQQQYLMLFLQIFCNRSFHRCRQKIHENS